MYDEYEDLVKEIGEIKVELLSIGEMIQEELKTHIPAPPKMLNPYAFGDPYDPKKKEQLKKGPKKPVKQVRLGIKR